MSLPPSTAAPRFVPTLTEVVDPPPDPVASPVAAVPPPALAEQIPTHAQPLLPEALEALQEQIAQRVLARVDAVLAGRLTDAIALVVLEQTRFMLPRLREEIAASVRSAVSAAVAEERCAPQPRPGAGRS